MLKAITIIQPFAHLIITGEKRVENRKWFTSFRGPIAIHAGKAKRYGGETCQEIAAYYDINPTDLDFGAVVGVAKVVDCVPVSLSRLDGSRAESIRRLPSNLHWLEEHEHAEGPFCWVMEMIWRCATPLSCDGKLGLWTVPSDLESRLRLQWKAEQEPAVATA